MGYGDNIMATGWARGMAARGRRLALGDGRQIRWDYLSEEIFQNNPNLARPGEEGRGDLEWLAYYRGNRLYARHDTGAHRWVWNMEFRPPVGEFFFSAEEESFAAQCGRDFVVIEPTVPAHKSCAPNKQWSPQRFYEVAKLLRRQDVPLRQFEGPNLSSAQYLPYAERIKTPTFRMAVAALSRARLYVGPEGGLHHAAAALGVPAVVIFGGFIPPQVTGYEGHENVSSSGHACGSLRNCEHCRRAMDEITVDRVMSSVNKLLKRSSNRKEPSDAVT